MNNGPKVHTDGLVFGYDTGYGVADNNTSTRYYPGKPTTNRASEFTDPSFQSLANGINPSTYPQLGSESTCEIVTFLGEKVLKVNRGSSNGAYNQNRIYWTRSANAGNYWSWSALVYSTTPGPSISLEAYGGGYNWGIGQVKSSSHSGNGWERLFVRSSSPLTGNTTMYNFIYANINADFYIKDIQFEYNQYPTPFTTGTRSSTQSLIDVTKTNDIDVSNVSFDSTGQPTFDGTDDNINLGYAPISGTGDFTISSTYKVNTSAANTIIGNYPNSSLQFMGGYGLYINGACYFTSTPLPPGTYYTTATRENGVCKIYLNGQLQRTTNNSNSIGTNSFKIGTNTSGTEPFNGEIYNIKIYNRALSADEIKQNFSSYRKRFNL